MGILQQCTSAFLNNCALGNFARASEMLGHERKCHANCTAPEMIVMFNSSYFSGACGYEWTSVLLPWMVTLSLVLKLALVSLQE